MVQPKGGESAPDSTAPKAIETHYEGYRFRSRLEARWAVFFDFLKIEWRYEQEGFNLPSGPYLPDFWFPGIHCWAEVKPVEFTPPQRVKVEDLGLSTGYPVACLVDIPGAKRDIALFAGLLTDAASAGWWTDVWWTSCEFCYRWTLMPWKSSIVTPQGLLWRNCSCPGTFTGDRTKAKDWDSPDTFGPCRAAIARARSARFEYGET